MSSAMHVCGGGGCVCEGGGGGVTDVDDVPAPKSET